MSHATTPAAAVPPDPSYPVRAMIRAGSTFPLTLQGTVCWWRTYCQRYNLANQRPYLPGPYFKSSPMVVRQDQDAKPWEWPAWPVELVLDPTEQQIAEEQIKVAEVRRQAEEWSQ